MTVFSMKRWLGLIVTFVLAGAFSALYWGLTYFQRFFIDSLADRRLDDFFFALELAAAFLLVGAVLSFTKEWWLASWINSRREQRFRGLSALYFSSAIPSTVESGLIGVSTVQRLVDDVREWAKDLVELQFSGASAAVSVLLLGFTLWEVVPEIDLWGWSIHGPMLWFSVGLFGLTSSALHMIGRRMPARESRRANAEGRLRDALATTREYARSIALQKATDHERSGIHAKLSEAFTATSHLALLRARISAAKFVLAPYELFAWVALSTYFFRGQLSLGQVSQGAMAHAAMGAALGWFYSNYEAIARLRAADERLQEWRESMASFATGTASRLKLKNGDELRVSGVRIFVPQIGEQGARAVSIPNFAVAAGECVLLRAHSGFGKSLLFSVIAGVWPWAEGTVVAPQEAIWVPQRPFFPRADLAAAVSYPGPSKSRMAEVAAALERVNLSHLMAYGSDVVDWNNTLSGGELSRLAIVRAVLQRPRWLFLDEATAALDDVAAEACWSWLREIEDLTIVAISHQPLEAVGWSKVVDLTAGESTVPSHATSNAGRCLNPAPHAADDGVTANAGSV